MKFLIAEDELVLAYTIAEMLKVMGYENTVIGHTFDKAHTLLKNNNLDIALLDINLGKGKGGIELARICAERNVPFIYLSSYSDKDTLDKALKTNPSAYLVKPISEGNLYTTIQIILDRQRHQTTPILEFKDGHERIKLSLDKVLYLKSENIYVNVVTHDKIFLYRGSLSSLMEKVPKGKLIRTHRAYAVNPFHVFRVSTTYVIINGIQIPVSRNFRQQVF